MNFETVSAQCSPEGVANSRGVASQEGKEVHSWQITDWNAENLDSATLQAVLWALQEARRKGWQSIYCQWSFRLTSQKECSTQMRLAEVKIPTIDRAGAPSLMVSMPSRAENSKLCSSSFVAESSNNAFSRATLLRRRSRKLPPSTEIEPPKSNSPVAADPDQAVSRAAG
ncbi:adipocyte enhancer-binding protein 1 [Striga asiatica]|uniref:Adipocyte enhancer-binding protein 1 n=1 Tax=Striga asiatica TaxID=4170 RepID=A0A5A7P0W1_STRAF|nr:adipocyte enhancer-binding protein 1 [Striga asiatica]